VCRPGGLASVKNPDPAGARFRGVGQPAGRNPHETWTLPALLVALPVPVWLSLNSVRRLLRQTIIAYKKKR
jgi:hypothetical protein